MYLFRKQPTTFEKVTTMGKDVAYAGAWVAAVTTISDLIRAGISSGVDWAATYVASKKPAEEGSSEASSEEPKKKASKKNA
ncbi:MAG: hypothetical protein CL582_20270 [Alteromonadaceae bacterium]|nr:hypothetical protein [Alteromonadaceae bacterium]|tara:strand:+ start:2793 stop:3035 length:243 start_codon:yes stop_codon:yes gene_type:complete